MKNELVKDEGTANGVYCGYYGGYQGNDSLYFNNGKLEASAYSYEIGGIGNIELSIEQTREIYNTMKLYFEK